MNNQNQRKSQSELEKELIQDKTVRVVRTKQNYRQVFKELGCPDYNPSDNYATKKNTSSYGFY